MFFLFIICCENVQSLSRVRLFVAPWTAAHQASLFFTVSRSFLKLMCIESVMPSKHLILCHPLLLLPLIFPSIRVFSNESALYIRWAKYWSFSFSINLSNEYSGLISFRIDWFDLLAIQKEISPGCSLEGLMLKLKRQYFSHLMQRADSLEKNPDAVKD